MKRKLKFTDALIGVFMFLLLWQSLAWIIRRPIMPAPVVVLPLFLHSIVGDLGLHRSLAADIAHSREIIRENGRPDKASDNLRLEPK